MVEAVAVTVAVAGAVTNPIHPQLIKFVPKYADLVLLKSNLVAPPCLTPARKAFQGGGLFINWRWGLLESLHVLAQAKIQTFSRSVQPGSGKPRYTEARTSWELIDCWASQPSLASEAK